MSTTLRVTAAVLFLIAACAGNALAQNYPTKAVRIVIAQAPGSATDVISRVVGNRLGEALGQSIVVDARPGAGGVLGTDIAAHSPADGYTLFMGNNSTHGSNPALYSKLPYDAIKDFVPIIYVAATPYVLSVHPSMPVKNLKELITFAKARPGQINYASAGNGSTHHFSGELLKALAGIDIVHVPYKGSTPALGALVAGEVSMMFSNVADTQPLIKANRIRSIAVTADKRSPAMPDVPTMAEAGLKDFLVFSWFGLLAPAGTPAAIITRINAETVKVLLRPDVKAALNAQGLEVISSTPEQFGNHIKTEIARMTKIAQSAGIKAD
jgi:tripartite-type tricarboxylate transporter receptor subunit TctC